MTHYSRELKDEIFATEYEYGLSFYKNVSKNNCFLPIFIS